MQQSLRITGIYLPGQIQYVLSPYITKIHDQLSMTATGKSHCFNYL